MSDVSGEEVIDEFAPADVRAAVGWLKDHRFVLASSDTDRGTFGSLWVLAREDAEVRVTVDRSQWFLDIARGRGRKPVQYELLVAAQRGQDHRDCFPRPDGGQPGERPSQLPAGVSWHGTLPQVLTWLGSEGYDPAAVELAQDQRYVMMWPDSTKARQMLQSWGEDH